MRIDVNLPSPFLRLMAAGGVWSVWNGQRRPRLLPFGLMEDIRFEPYIAAWKERWQSEHQREQRAVEARRETAERLLPRAAERLVALGARRVWLAGSLARGEFGERS